MAGLIGGMFERFEARQALFFNYLPGDARQKLAEAENRYAELRVTGPGGSGFRSSVRDRMYLMKRWIRFLLMGTE